MKIEIPAKAAGIRLFRLQDEEFLNYEPVKLTRSDVDLVVRRILLHPGDGKPYAESPWGLDILDENADILHTIPLSKGQFKAAQHWLAKPKRDRSVENALEGSRS